MPEESVAYIDIDLEDLIPEYLDNRREDIAAIRGYLDTGDLNEIQRLGHSMKGSGGGYGFGQITEIGSAIEEAAIASSIPEIQEAVDYLETYLSTVKIVWQDDV